MATENKPIFRSLNADDPESTEIDSLCLNCSATGITRLLLTKIPFYKEVVLMSFSCEECGHENNEIQNVGQIPEKGINICLKVQSPKDLNRQVVKSDFCSITIVELEFEIPSKTQRAEITTIESIIERSITGLQQDQPLRRRENGEFADQIDIVINKLKELKDGIKPFTLVLNDISGNSFIQNPNAPQADSQIKVKYFNRTTEENHELGIYSQSEVSGNEGDAILHAVDENEFTYEDLQGEVLQFPSNCHNCNVACETNMKLTNIPHFKEVVIMATVCDYCGHRTNEIKSGGGIEPLGVRVEIDISTQEDLKRDLLKSETCHLSIPQLELEVGPNALSGRFTTVEGLLVAIKEQLSGNIFQDSQDEASRERLHKFVEQFDHITECRMQATLVLDDPAGNSYIQTMRDDGTPDDALKITRYERTFDQNEELGLNDMKTENY